MTYSRTPLPVKTRIFVWIALLVSSAGLGSVSCAATPDSAATVSTPDWLTFRFRSDASVDLNADTGWAARENAPATLFYDQPFRFRIQVRANDAPAHGHLLSLQYREQQGSWLPVGVADFPYPAFASPTLSVISTPAYEHGAETERLLGAASLAWDEGAGLNAVASTPVWRTTDEAMEWEWPLVVRRFSDGPTFADNNTVFELRVVDGSGQALTAPGDASMRLHAAPGHLGGTFVETPARLGPYQSEAGHLYFFMEPSETDNRFMAVKSTDSGQTWREVDGAGRPRADDLEGVASTRTGSVIHLLHQVSEEVFYHAFEMGGPDSGPGRWLVDSESIATPAEPPTQFADLVALSDGRLVALYGGARRLFMQTRSAQGIWGEPVEIDADVAPVLSGPVLAAGPDDVVTIAYTGRDGRGFVRHRHPDGSLTARQVISSNLGTRDSENGAIVPPVVIPETGATVLVYREQDGLLYERRLSTDAQLSAPVRISEFSVMTDAVDSEQVGADLVLHDGILHLLFIDAQSRAIYHSQSTQAGVWSAPEAVVENVEAGWVRGSIHMDANGNAVYGFVFDAGSQGGSGFNRYVALPLQ